MCAFITIIAVSNRHKERKKEISFIYNATVAAREATLSDDQIAVDKQINVFVPVYVYVFRVIMQTLAFKIYVDMYIQINLNA